MEDVTPRLPGGDDSDDHARYIEAVVPGKKGVVRVASVYAPNGNPIGTEKFTYKLSWLDRFDIHAKELLDEEEPVALMGDYNVIPMAYDCWDPKAWEKDALYQPESRAALRRIEYLGYTDAIKACHAEKGLYTFWDYQEGAWRKNHGIRIDHILLSPQAADHLKASGIDKEVRAGERPSDHVPVWCELDI